MLHSRDLALHFFPAGRVSSSAQGRNDYPGLCSFFLLILCNRDFQPRTNFLITIFSILVSIPGQVHCFQSRSSLVTCQDRFLCPLRRCWFVSRGPTRALTQSLICFVCSAVCCAFFIRSRKLVWAPDLLLCPACLCALSLPDFPVELIRMSRPGFGLDRASSLFRNWFSSAPCCFERRFSYASAGSSRQGPYFLDVLRFRSSENICRWFLI
jgi:hypothetical protein